MQYSKYGLLVLGLMLIFLGCQSDNKLNKTTKTFSNKEKDIRDTLVVNKEGITDCQLLLELLGKDCVKITARLNVSTLREIVILVPSDKYRINCQKFFLDKVSVSITHKVINFDSIRNMTSYRDDPSRVLYLIEYIDNNQAKILELIYGPSGSIYKIEAQNNGIGWFIRESFCASF